MTRATVKPGPSPDRPVQTAEARVRMLLECLRLPAVALDAKGAIAFCNEELLRLSGYEADDLAGRPWIDTLVPVRDRAVIGAALQELRASGTQLHFESALLTKDGRERLISWSNAAFFGSKGVVVETIGIGEDVTDERRHAQDLAALREREAAAVDELERERAQRSTRDAIRADAEAQRADAEAQRAEAARREADEACARAAAAERQAQEESARAAAALRRAEQEQRRADLCAHANADLLSVIGGGVRRPLERIIDAGGVLLEAPGADQRAAAESLRTSSERLLTLLNDLADVARIEAGSFTLGAIDFDVRETVEDVVAGLAPDARAKGLDLTTLIHCDVPPLLRGDAGRIRQLLSSLTSRAIRATKRGEVTVSVDLDARNDQRATVRFTVADTGPGIAPDDRQRLFELPAEADSGADPGPGVTLGYALASRLAEAMGGRMTADSDPAIGSFCSFSLPLDCSLVARATGAAPVSVDDGALRGRRVLLADAHALSRRSLAGRLVALGCSVTEAETGADTLRLLREAQGLQCPVDLVLVSAPLPDDDGEAVGRAVRQDPALAGVPLAVLSASGMRGDAARFEQAGYSAYFAKPVTTDELRTFLRQLAAHGHGATIVTRHSLRADSSAESKPRVLFASKRASQRKGLVRALDRAGCRVQIASGGHELIEALRRSNFDLALVDTDLPDVEWNEMRHVIGPRLARRPMPMVAVGSGADGEREAYLAQGADDYVARTARPAVFASLLETLLPRRTP